MKAFIIQLFVCVSLTGVLHAQQRRDSSAIIHSNDSMCNCSVCRGKLKHQIDTGYYYGLSICKSVKVLPLLLFSQGNDTVSVVRERTRKAARPVIPAVAKPFLTIHGNVMYDLYYRSNLDTPFVEKDVYQHTLQTYLDVTVKDQYPMRIAFTTSIGNSDFFRNITGVNLQYTNRDFKQSLLNKAQSWESSQMKLLAELQSIREQADEKIRQVNQLKNAMAAPSRLQKMVEENERELYGRIRDSLVKNNREIDTSLRIREISITGNRHLYKPKIKDLITWQKNELSAADTVSTKLSDVNDRTQRRIDSLKEDLAKLEHLYEKKRQKVNTAKTHLVDVLMNSRSNKELADELGAMNLPDSILPKGYRNLLAIRSIGLGRTLVDYSELTAKDISITGVQAEYNPSWYLAFATGAVDYRFRDFVIGTNRTKQYLNLVRVGAGMKEGNNVILTYYTGKKQLYNFSSAGTVNNTEWSPDYNIMGLSLEGRWQINPNNYVVGEVAKSSIPYYAAASKGQKGFSSMFGFGDRSNEAWSVKAFSFIPRTATSINGVYKSMGANFQSFSLYTTGSSQSSWSLRIDQPFWRRQLSIAVALRKNDFQNTYQYLDFHSNTVYKSIQATLRIKKWPVISVGYYPSSQLTKLSEDHYVENRFYTFTGTASHLYRYHGIMMNTIFSFTQFYNRQTDSNFVYFNTRNVMFNHTVLLNRFTLNTVLSAAKSSDYTLYNADGNLQFKVNKWLEMGGGVKYNRQTVYGLQQIGYSANSRMRIPYFGELSLFADKGFIPGANKRLTSNNVGRITYTKIF
ncbi:hypothetical protein FHW36_10416 [Chitinophaga polysaccharea]|uniref:Uncharacterized protein n=1 Tax=Chitinophaga polysaccharea TaxID=1293035 RepID=A0A561PQD2_9BACT|nr:hypothetical protein [Chitinophaga polysaccharea]TWF40334.1 hypothetical protein FHW36_10416 [Chitinophaga polysaccharea]